MSLRVTFSLLSFLLGTASAAYADVLSVPQDHATLQAAVDAAADGDTIVVAVDLPTEQVVIQGKGLTLVASSDRFRLRTLAVLDLPASSTFVARGLDVLALSNPFLPTSNGPALTLEDNAGCVHIEDSSFVGDGGFHPQFQAPVEPSPGARVLRSAGVVFGRCTFEGGAAAGYSTDSIHEPADGACGLDVQESRVAVAGSSLLGGAGGCGEVEENANDGRGGDGLRNEGGFVSASGCTITGADSGLCSFNGGGGDAIRQAGRAAQLWLRAVTLSVGQGSGGVVGEDGQPLVVVEGAVGSFGGRHAYAAASSPLREGQAGTLTLVGAAGETALLLASLQPDFVPLPGRAGVLTAGPPYLTTLVPLGPLPFSGVLQVALRVDELGPGVSAVDIHLQALFSGGGSAVLGAGTVSTFLDDAF